MEKKQTAVEWLVEQIEKDENVRLRGLNIRNLLEQAKQMEREQMKYVYLTHCVKAERLRKIFEQQFDDYYNETYGGIK